MIDNVQEFVKRRDAVLLGGDEIDAEAALAWMRESNGKEPSGDEERKRRIALAACHKARLGLAYVSKSQRAASIAWLGLNGFRLPEWYRGKGADYDAN